MASKKNKTYIALTGLDTSDGKRYEKGDVCELTASDVEAYLEMGVIKAGHSVDVEATEDNGDS